MMKISYPYKLSKTCITWLQRTYKKPEKEWFQVVSHNPLNSKLKTGPFEPVYKGNYHIVAIKGNQVEDVPAEGGKSQMVHITDVKYILPADNIIAKLPDYRVCAPIPKSVRIFIIPVLPNIFKFCKKNYFILLSTINMQNIMNFL